MVFVVGKYHSLPHARARWVEYLGVNMYLFSSWIQISIPALVLLHKIIIVIDISGGKFLEYVEVSKCE